MNHQIGEYWKYAHAIREAEHRYAIPDQFLARVLYRECQYDEKKIAGIGFNDKGCIGIAGFMHNVALRYGVQSRTEPFACIDAAGRYLRDLYRQRKSWHFAALAFKYGEQWGLDLPEHSRKLARDYVEFVTANVAL